jgi:hypothetical protein
MFFLRAHHLSRCPALLARSCFVTGLELTIDFQINRNPPTRLRPVLSPKIHYGLPISPEQRIHFFFRRSRDHHHEVLAPAVETAQRESVWRCGQNGPAGGIEGYGKGVGDVWKWDEVEIGRGCVQAVEQYE